ncbi:GFA family protein [Sphingomonas sp.]|uniref:GFA family protein n=1 Tax=Sphingomonas sp. TaxID=28214 RepID=UPI000DB49D14|nr:GFA family protein [Sphingomonas sp.]PZU09677.1 MAG: aldehyde-activating protein [Sphingomonas sp.]
MAYAGSCHCGAVAFRVEAELPAEAISCNCSHCRRKGFLLAFHPADQFALTAGEESLVTYMFNQHKLRHRFCKTCGTQAFAEGQGPSGAEMRAVNLRCVPDCDPDALTIRKINGASF